MTTILRWVGSDYFKLVPVLALAFYIGFIPHQSYPYPVHLDEWHNYAYAQALTSAHSISFPDPWRGGGPQLFPNPEVGYNVFWSVFHMVSGIPLLTIYRFFPSVIFMFTALAVYVLCRREGFGWEASLFVCLIPTTVGILGPAFMVPVALGLAFMPLALFIALNYRTWWSYTILYVFIMFMLAIHAPTAVGLMLVLVPFILLNLKGSFWHSIGLALALGSPFILRFPWVSSILRDETQGLLTASELSKNVALPHIMGTYGYIPVTLGVAGIIAFVFKGGKKRYGLLLGLLVLLLMLVVRYTFHYGEDIMYFRGLHYMMLMMSIVAGAGLMLIREIRLPESLPVPPGMTPVTRHIGNILCLALVGLILYTAIPERQDTRYYHMIDETDYQAFVWIKDNVDASYQKAVLDPWKATAFTAITGRPVVTRIGEAPTVKDAEAVGFLTEGCKDTGYLRDNGIAIVYTPAPVNNAELVEVRQNIYLFREAPVP
jgi:hypothetical protein